MPILKTIRVHFDGKMIPYRVSINQDGLFTTTLPREIADPMKAVGIDLRPNQLKNYGYFEAHSLQELREKIGATIAEFNSRELKDERVVIRYVIQTMCSYCLDTEGRIAPNCESSWTGFVKKSQFDHNDWKGGTVNSHVESPTPYGILMYARAFVKQTFVFKTGKEEVEYNRIDFDNDDYPHGTFLHRLNSFSSMKEPTFGHHADKYEIDYTETRAEFFCQLLESICRLNEQIKDYLMTPEALIKIADSGRKLLI